MFTADEPSKIRPNPISDAELLKLETLNAHFEERKFWARARLSAVPEFSAPGWYFAILGLEIECSEFAFEPVAKLVRVVEPPAEIELAQAARDPSIFGALGRYANGINVELAVPCRGRDDQCAFNTGWWIISALRARTCADFLVVAVDNSSWSTIAAIDDGT